MSNYKNHNVYLSIWSHNAMYSKHSLAKECWRSPELRIDRYEAKKNKMAAITWF